MESLHEFLATAKNCRRKCEFEAVESLFSQKIAANLLVISWVVLDSWNNTERKWDVLKPDTRHFSRTGES